MYYLFFITVFLLAFTPGPNVVLMINNGLRYQLKDAIFAIFGILSGLIVFALISSFSVQGVFKFSTNFYTYLKFIGAFYLIYLGIKNICNKDNFKFEKNEPVIKPNKINLYYESLICCLTNPKILFLYITLLPNYIVNEKNILIQTFILSLIQISVVVLSMFTYLLIANRAAKILLSKIKYIRYISGSVMILLALSLLIW
ncbi:LysE family translocator [Pigmentibacter sp. JX0631]|uniref:LysE family translocator n=1 Tax=Pigmentibacter sp. JX0631 TaxID=2976982 RepID=UPI0024689417|nr:LysE family translocator [Pigmentibacter sp. JX0631]WGL60504.1 LysE family translocator [Pigmentibacter sp. JX0631]